MVVGAGPTGVEMAGQIAELARDTLPGDFRAIDPSAGRVLLVEAADRVLPAFPEALSERARRALDDLGVTSLAGHTVDRRRSGVGPGSPAGRGERADRVSHGRLGRRGRGVPTRARPRRGVRIRGRPCRARHRRARPHPARAPRGPGDRRHGPDPRRRAAGPRPGGEAAGPVRRAADRRPARASGRRPRSATATAAISPRSAARGRSPTSTACAWPASRRGRSGSWSTWCTWSVSRTAPSCSSAGRTTSSRTAAAAG